MVSHLGESSLLKTLWKMEKMLVTNQHFLLFQQCFFFSTLSKYFITIAWILDKFCKMLLVWKGLIFVVWERDYGYWLIDCLVFLKLFSTIFLLYRGGQCSHRCFPEILFNSSLHKCFFFSSHWLLSHITIVKPMNSDERGVNSVDMTIINPRQDWMIKWCFTPLSTVF